MNAESGGPDFSHPYCIVYIVFKQPQVALVVENSAHRGPGWIRSGYHTEPSIRSDLFNLSGRIVGHINAVHMDPQSSDIGIAHKWPGKGYRTDIVSQY